jgi:esterase/lipase superfamily enzyme
MRNVVRALCWTLLPVAPLPLFAQSTDLLQIYQNFEIAKATNQVAQALQYGNDALRLAETDDRSARVDLLRSLGEYAAQASQDAQAGEYYERALALQEAELGPDHPDLVPVLSALTDLRLRAQRYAEAEALLQRILTIERAAYGEHHPNAIATLGKLRELYRATGNTEGLARVEALLRPAAPVERGLSPAPPGLASRNRRYPQTQGFATVRVFYGTNRAPTGAVKPAEYYGKARGELQYGELEVTIPRIHKEAALETRSRWSEYTFGADQATLRSRYVLLDRVAPLARGAFVQALRQQIASAPSRDVFIFVHGFNNSFEDTARRTAQLAYDLDFDGTPMMYSWPSQGTTTAYAIDEATAGIAGRRMAEFLDTVVSQSGAQRIHLIAHSMGNRVLIEALQTYLARRALDKRQGIFGQIVFTAPDVDRDYFVDALESLASAAERVTLYASDNDYALRTSQFIHGAPRAGIAGETIIRTAGLDTIDMSAVPADALGHSYFAANAGAIFDIFSLLWRGDPPSKRCGMSAQSGAGAVAVWRYNVEDCQGDEVFEAGLLLKRFGDAARARVMANIATLTDPSQKQQWSLILKQLDRLLASPAPPAGATATK